MNANPFYSAFADDVLNSCAFCKHIEYIADYNHHICMLNKHVISPSSTSCSKYFPVPDLKN